MADVFLSYSSKDRAAAQRVQEALSARGIDVFWDQQTPPGQDWDTWIRGKLSTCKVAVVLWSRTSVASDNVRHEALMARKAKKLLPVMIDSLTPEDLPMGFYMVQSMQLGDWSSVESKGLVRLADEVEARLGRRSMAAPQQAVRAGMSPRAQRTLALVVIAAMVAGIAWLMTQTPKEPSRISSSEALTPGDGTATPAPGPTCLDGSIPTGGLCANGNRPIPPAPVLGIAGKTLSQRIIGRWNRDGLACANGQNVTLEYGRLVFATSANRFVHAIEKDLPLETLTRVTDCAGCDPSMRGHQYRLSIEPMAASDARNFNLVVENLTFRTRNTWSPCELK